MHVVFMGSPEFAIPSLEALAGSYPIVGVVTQPDRPAGRGRALRQSAVKSWSLERGFPVAQPDRLKDPDAIEQLLVWKPSIIVVAAFGQILPPAVLDLPEWGCLNVHASLLPHWRGAAPIQAAIRHGDADTGVTIMKMDPGLDTGPILSQRSITIHPDETGGDLTTRLAVLGAELLSETIPRYIQRTLQPIPQDDTQATHAPMLKKSDGRLDFSLPAKQLALQVRAYEPWPGSFLIWSKRRLGIRKAHAVQGSGGMHGHVTEVDGSPAVATGSGMLVLDVVQPAGSKQMPGDAFARGARHFLNAYLGTEVQDT